MKRGVNKVCVENKNWDGVAGFTLSTRGCEKFEITPNAIDSNAADVKIVLKPTHYQVAFKFYQKPMSRKMTVRMESAMEENSKMKILSNDLIRRLLSSSEGLGGEEEDSG